MDNYIKIISNFEKIDEIIDINTRINALNNNLIKNIYSSFDFDINNNINLLKKKNLLKVKFYIKNQNSKESIECPICYNYCNNYCNNNIFKTSCNHTFCKSCYEKWDNTCNFNNINTTCPICRNNKKIERYIN